MSISSSRPRRRPISTLVRVAPTGLLAILLISCGSEKPATAEKKASAVTVTAAVAQVENLARTLDVSGSVSAWEEVLVGAETGGLIATSVKVDEGDYVQAGQVLVTMNDDLLQAELRQQTAAVASAQARLAQQNAVLKRSTELQGKGFLSDAALDTSVADQRAAQANCQSAQAARASALERLKRATIVAPVAGLISSRTVVKGQIVSAGAELFRLVRDGRLELDAQVPETEVLLVRPGMSGEVTADEVGRVQGTVRIVTPLVDPKSRLGVARISLPPRSGFRPGMFARASIAVDSAPTPVVAQSSVVYRSGKAGVFVVDGESRARFRAVQPGLRVGDRVAIVSGLGVTEPVVVKGAGFLNDGDRISVVKDAAVAPASAAAPKTPAKQ